jgi:tetratricopeptide (TPR) repeat protein
MGGFKCLERLKENEEILDSFQEISQLFQTFFPLHIEKCKIFLNTSDYENALDYINTKVNIKHFEIYKIVAVCNLISEGNFKQALTNIDKMWELLITQEPKNPELYYSNAQLFSRICDRKLDVILKTEKMIDRALEFSPKNAKYLIEKAYYRLYNGDIDKAFEIFTKAGEIDSNNKDSTYGLIYCKIIKQKYKEAQDDMEFLKEIFVSVGIQIHPKIMFFEGIIKFIKGEKEEVVGSIISEALNSHVKLARQQLLNKYEILIVTEFDFLYELAKSKLLK